MPQLYITHFAAVWTMKKAVDTIIVDMGRALLRDEYLGFILNNNVKILIDNKY
jgi:hypothetical protein